MTITSSTSPALAPAPTRLSLSVRRAGFSGLAMLGVILVNGPLAAARGIPQYWEPNGASAIGSRLSDARTAQSSIVFFFLSTLIFVFGIPFIAGLRRAVNAAGRGELPGDVVLIGGVLFFGGGLLSEVLSTGFAIVVQSAPSYALDPNSATAIEALQFTALIQGQVGLGIAMIAVSLAMSRTGRFSAAVFAVGLLAGIIDLLRPLAVANPVLAIALFLPTFVWIALASAWLISVRTDDMGAATRG